MQNKLKISIGITYLPVDSEEITYLTRECIRRVKENTYNPFELIFASNGLTTLDFGEDVRVVNKENKGNAKLWDQIVGASSGDIVFVMDNDVFVEPDWDVEMVDKLSDSQIGIVFPYSKRGNLDEEYAGRKDGFLFGFRKETYNKVGAFVQDQPFHSYYEDDYFAYRVQEGLGLKLIACPSSKVWHKGQGSTKKIWSSEIENGIEDNDKWYRTKTGNVFPYLNS